LVVRFKKRTRHHEESEKIGGTSSSSTNKVNYRDRFFERLRLGMGETKMAAMEVDVHEFATEIFGRDNLRKDFLSGRIVALEKFQHQELQ